MNTKIADLALLFTSAFVGATIAFLAALVTFTFHHEIQERLVQRGLIIPPNEPQPENPALRPPNAARFLLEMCQLTVLINVSGLSVDTSAYIGYFHSAAWSISQHSNPEQTM